MVFTKKLCYTDSKGTFEPINKEDIPMQLTVRQPSASEDAKHYTTERLRGEYLIETVFAPDDAILTYSHFDRIIAGGVMPVSKSVELVGCKELASDTFLQRREMGVINIGGKGKIAVDGVEYDLKQYDGLYVGMGAKTLSFTSDDPADPAKFYKNMDRHGNTSAASIPVALNEMAEAGLLKAGQKVSCIGFGGGLTWGGMLVTYSPLSHG